MTRPRQDRIRLSAGGRPRGLLDGIELLVARRAGHTLSPLQGLLVQLVTLAVVLAVFLVFVESGAFAATAEWFGRLLAGQMLPALTPRP